MPSPAILVAIPSLHGGELLLECLRSLTAQTEQDFEVIVVDNSGSGEIAQALHECGLSLRLRFHQSPRNVGFAAAINQAYTMTLARYLVTLNDDTEAHPGWLAALRRAVESSPDVGMCASQVRIHGTTEIDSAGMLLCFDGSSKQRGQGQPSERFSQSGPALLPSASAALYRSEMLDDIGMFDEDFFLYCEDTDLGLRGRWNGWECVYVADAIVEHHYSQSAGAASPLKAWHIERNRLWVAAKNFPIRMLLAVPFHGAMRYSWHAIYLLRGRGTASRYRDDGNPALALLSMVARAHWALLTNFRTLLRKRRAVRKGALITDTQFRALARRYAISPREIARL